MEVDYMTKEQALHQFFNQFGITGYRNTSVPDDVIFPFLTYDTPISSFEEDPVSITLNLYFYTDSEADPDAKAEQIRQAIGMGGVLLNCDGGAIWLKWGAPWCQSLVDETNRNIKRRYINITAEYFTL
jgi:hypothetical protein